jgi:hypothetical protein
VWTGKSLLSGSVTPADGCRHGWTIISGSRSGGTGHHKAGAAAGAVTIAEITVPTGDAPFGIGAEAQQNTARINVANMRQRKIAGLSFTRYVDASIGDMDAVEIVAAAGAGKAGVHQAGEVVGEDGDKAVSSGDSAMAAGISSR